MAAFGASYFLGNPLILCTTGAIAGYNILDRTGVARYCRFKDIDVRKNKLRELLHNNLITSPDLKVALMPKSCRVGNPEIFFNDGGFIGQFRSTIG